MFGVLSLHWLRLLYKQVGYALAQVHSHTGNTILKNPVTGRLVEYELPKLSGWAFTIGFALTVASIWALWRSCHLSAINTIARRMVTKFGSLLLAAHCLPHGHGLLSISGMYWAPCWYCLHSYDLSVLTTALQLQKYQNGVAVDRGFSGGAVPALVFGVGFFEHVLVPFRDDTRPFNLYRELCLSFSLRPS